MTPFFYRAWPMTSLHNSFSQPPLPPLVPIFTSLYPVPKEPLLLIVLTFTTVDGDFCKGVITAVTTAPDHTWLAGALASLNFTGTSQRACWVAVTEQACDTLCGSIVVLLRSKRHINSEQQNVRLQSLPYKESVNPLAESASALSPSTNLEQTAAQGILILSCSFPMHQSPRRLLLPSTKHTCQEQKLPGYTHDQIHSC